MAGTIANGNYIPHQAQIHRQEYQALVMSEFRMLTHLLLKANPQGLDLPTVQKCVGMSAKTAKKVLAGVAEKQGDKYVLKGATA